MPHPDERFYTTKCPTHGCLHCYDCFPVPLAADPIPGGASLEDGLVGRTTPPQAAPATAAAPSPGIEDSLVGRSTPAPETVQPNRESPAEAIVRASQDYAKAQVALEKAVRLVQELEKRLNFARENVDEELKKRDQALDAIRNVVGVKSCPL